MRGVLLTLAVGILVLPAQSAEALPPEGGHLPCGAWCAPSFGPWDTCDDPGPPGSYVDEELGRPPADVRGLTVTVYPNVGDRDVVICSLRAPTAEELRADPYDTEVRWRQDAYGANVIGEPCSNAIGVPEAPVGCVDTATTTVVGGRPYKLVVYNIADVGEARYEWQWT